MKKIYTLLTVAFLAGTAYGTDPVPVKKATGKTNSQKIENALKAWNQGLLHSVARHQPSVNQVSTVIWSDDFSIPSHWTIATEAGTIDNWVIGTNGPGGQYKIDTIHSTTRANGFALFDSDLLCSANQIADLTTATPINCSAYPNVRLNFEQYYRHYIDSTFIFVSNDNVNWTKFVVNGNLAQDEFSDHSVTGAMNPDNGHVNISSVAGGQATVWVRFQFYSPTSLGAGSGCGYAWMLDDISITDIPANDVALAIADYPSEYTVVPTLQTLPLSLSAKASNEGTAAATGVVISFEVFDSQFNSVFAGLSSTVASLLPGDTSATLSASGVFTPPDTGLYYMLYVVSMTGADANSSNDTAIQFFYVDTQTYARDLSEFGGNFIGGFGIDAATIKMGQIFHVVQQSQFTSVEFYLASPPLNDHISVSVYDIVAGVPTNLLASSNVYTITPADTAGLSVKTLSFPTPVNVNTGDYFVCLNQLDLNNITLGASSGIYSTGKILYKINAGAWQDVINTAPLAWILRVNNPASTLNTVKPIETNINLSVYPNPSKGVVFIDSNGNNSKNVRVDVISELGQIVLSRKYTSLTHEKIDLSNQPNGVYTIQIHSDAGISSQSIVISGK